MQSLTRFTKALGLGAITILLAVSLHTAGCSRGGIVWTSLGPEDEWITALAVNPVTPTTLYAGTLGGVFRGVELTTR